MKMVASSDYAHIRGFNYQPSYGSSGLELWQMFDGDQIRREFERGAELFPKMNAVRFWLDFHGWCRDPKRFLRNLDTALGIFADCGCRVMPVIFNRWHDETLDYGGIYVDHLVHSRDLFMPRMLEYARQVVNDHAGDGRLLMWDLCNEPYFRVEDAAAQLPEVQAEYEWLETVRDMVREVDTKTPITIGTVTGTNVDLYEPLVDVIQIHPYFIPGRNDEPWRQEVERLSNLANAKGKPLIVGECCWGSLDDAERAHRIEIDLGLFNERQIGWLAYLLWTSRVADAHGPELGPVGRPKNLAFILPDGSLRPHHEIIYDYM